MPHTKSVSDIEPYHVEDALLTLQVEAPIANEANAGPPGLDDHAELDGYATVGDAL